MTSLTIAAAAVWCSLFASPQAGRDWRVPLLLFTLALACELQPVHFTRQGLRITCSMPFVAGICVAYGPLAAIAADALLVVLSALAGPHAFRRSSLIAVRSNVVVAVAASGLACASFVAFCQAPASRAGVYGGAAAFAVAYVVLNALLVVGSRREALGRMYVGHGVRVLNVLLAALCFYCLMSVSIAVLLFQGMALALPVMMLPAIMLRRALVLKNAQIENHYEAVVALTVMMQRAHPYTHGHLERVAELAEEVALRLGLGLRKAKLVREAAVLHDLGKIAIDEEILDLPRKLTADEFDHVRLHSAYGADILEGSQVFRPLAPWVRSHHERPDGNGYPDRLKDCEIPIESKIIAVVDAYDAMVGGPEASERRPYRRPMGFSDAVRELERCAGAQFDTGVVKAFCGVLQDGRSAWTR